MEWKRLFARSIDETAFAYILFFILDAWNVDAANKPGIGFVIQFVIFPVLFIPVESIQLAIFGRTLGKSLLGLRVEHAGKNPDMKIALRRSFLVWWRGLAAGVPVLSVVAMGIAYSRFRDKGTTSWDEELGMKVTSSRGQIGSD